jgi:2'-5' RNA ligase
MSEQPSFFKEPPPRFGKYNLFLGLFPDTHTAERLIEFGNTFRQKHGLHGRLRPISHLHVSLFFLGGADEVPQSAVEIISRVSRTVAAATRPFEIRFDQVRSFHGRPGNHPLVLVGDERGSEGAKKLHESLCAEFLKHPSRARQFIPHLTLLYDRSELAPVPVEPISWAVREFIFVLSEVGATKYDSLGRWELGG